MIYLINREHVDIGHTYLSSPLQCSRKGAQLHDACARANHQSCGQADNVRGLFMGYASCETGCPRARILGQYPGYFVRDRLYALDVRACIGQTGARLFKITRAFADERRQVFRTQRVPQCLESLYVNFGVILFKSRHR